MKIVAITGSIGCGKTYLSNIIKKLGFSVYNPDEWVRDLYKKDNFLKIIQREFPQSFDEKGIFHKRNLRNMVFNDNELLKKLENIIHPFLKKKFKQIIHKYAKKNEFLFIDVALLYEMNWNKYCDFTIVADVDDELQMKRVIQRDHITQEDFMKIIKIQMDKKETKKNADFIIDTGLTYGINKAQLIKFIQEVRFL